MTGLFIYYIISVKITWVCGYIRLKYRGRNI